VEVHLLVNWQEVKPGSHVFVEEFEQLLSFRTQRRFNLFSL
jgi:hypothetical protein